MIYTKILNVVSLKSWLTVTADSDNSPNYIVPLQV